jgi:hypothetical protein
MKFRDIPTESDHELHRRWFLIPTIIFALLAAVAVFGHDHPGAAATSTASAAPAPAADRL